MPKAIGKDARNANASVILESRNMASFSSVQSATKELDHLGSILSTEASRNSLKPQASRASIAWLARDPRLSKLSRRTQAKHHWVLGDFLPKDVFALQDDTGCANLYAWLGEEEFNFLRSAEGASLLEAWLCVVSSTINAED